MDQDYSQLGLDEILGACRMLYPEPDEGLVEALGAHLLGRGWPGQIVRRHFDLAFHDGMGSYSFLEQDGKTVNLQGHDPDEVLTGLVQDGTTYRWSLPTHRSDQPHFTVHPVDAKRQVQLDALIGHLDTHLRLQDATPQVATQSTRARPRM